MVEVFLALLHVFRDGDIGIHFQYQPKWDVGASLATAGPDSGGGTVLLRVGRLEEEEEEER